MEEGMELSLMDFSKATASPVGKSVITKAVKKGAAAPEATADIMPAVPNIAGK